MKNVRVAAFAAALLSIVNSVAFAQDGCIQIESDHLIASDASYGQDFGFSAAVHGDVAVIGADSISGVQPGAAYVFERIAGSWQETAKFEPTGSTYSNTMMGYSVATDGTTIVSCARFDSGAGAAYVYRKVAGQWQQIARLTASDGHSIDAFGISVSVEGDTIVVGAPNNSEDAVRAGAAYVFQKVDGTWQQVAMLTAGDGESYRNFGETTALVGGTLLVSGPSLNSGTPSAYSGRVFVFRNVAGQWQQQAVLAATDSAGGERFGAALGFDGTTIAVGAPYYLDAAGHRGTAYVFRNVNGQWQQVAQLFNDAANPGGFAYRVAVSGETVLASAYVSLGQSSNIGVARLYSDLSNGWGAFATLAASDSQTYDGFGSAIALDGLTAVVGAANDRTPTIQSGSVYVFDVFSNAIDCNANGVPDVCDIQTGASGDCNGNGIPDACEIQRGLLESAKLQSGSETGDWFGSDIASDNGTVVIGAPRARVDGVTIGAAYIFRNDARTWQPIAELTATDADSFNDFGGSVAISGNTAVIGAPVDDDQGYASGAAYVFEEVEGQWQQVAKLTPDDGAQSDYFGMEVAIEGDTIVVGTKNADEGMYGYRGAAYVFEKIEGTWQQTARLDPTSENELSAVGYDVAIDQNRIGFSATERVGTGDDIDSIFLFEKTGGIWTQTDRIEIDNANFSAFNGQSFAISGNTLVAASDVYAPNDSQAVGRVHVFDHIAGAWQETAVLTSNINTVSNNFGYSVELKGDTLVASDCREIVGADVTLQNGPTHVFHRLDGEWVRVQRLTASDITQSDLFGSSMAIEGDTILTSATLHAAGYTGAVYVHDLNSLMHRGDLDNDGAVTAEDLAIFIDVLLKRDTALLHVARADMNCSGDVDGRDVQLFVARWRL